MEKIENLLNQNHKTKILSEINDILPKIKELRKYYRYCKNIKERSKSMQGNIDNSRSL